jgi:mannose-6-phosphate isomerase-like protein (cupin superfamily)
MGGNERGIQGWPWPAELDGPIAAPDQHAVIFENEQVRVLQVTIRPGEIAPLHTHRRPTLMYVLSGSHFIRRDEAGSIVVDTRAAVPPFEMPPVMWRESNPAHTLENSGEEDFVLIAVELKDRDAAAT